MSSFASGGAATVRGSNPLRIRTTNGRTSVFRQTWIAKSQSRSGKTDNGRTRRGRSLKNQHGRLAAIRFALWLRSDKISETICDDGGSLMFQHAKYWRSRAEEARLVAESLEDLQSKRIMLGIAGDYGRMAELAEQRMRSGDLPSAPWPG